jgi:hypothetical protein
MSTSDNLDAIGHHVLNAIVNNASIEVKTTISAGYGKADYTRILGMQFDEGIKSNYKIKLFEFDGLVAAKTLIAEKNLDLAILDGFSMDDLSATFNIGGSEGIYAGDFSASLKSDITDSYGLEVGVTGGLSALKASAGLEASYSFKQKQFSGDWNLGLGIELFNSSHDVPFMSYDGMQIFEDTTIEFNFSISGFFKDGHKKNVENIYNKRKVTTFDK